MPLRALAPRLLFALALLLVLLAAAELLLWGTGKMEDPTSFRFRRVTQSVAEDREGRYALHPSRLYALAPHFKHSDSHLGRDATGAWPFRGRPAEPAPPSLLRVAIIGDSVVYGAALDAADMPGSRLQAALAERGWTPDRVEVLSLGVPGYSTVQLGLLLDEALATLRLDAVVLWPAAWNDQAPALNAPDAELLRSLVDPTPLEWLRNHTRVVGALLHVQERLPFDEVLAGWRQGAPPRGWRVPAAEVGPNVAAMLERCAQAGVPAVVLASAHPAQTAAEHPRTRQDALAVLAAARAAGVPAVDAQAVLDAAGGDPARWFVDYVHPSPDATPLLAAALADALRPALDARADTRGAAQPSSPPSSPPSASPSAPPTLAIVAIEPRDVPALGDATLRVGLEGWTSAEPLPVVVVGGAPLIDLRAAGEHAVEGRLMANAAGELDVVVQTGRACAWLPGALRSHDATIALVEAPARLRVGVRAGDSVQLFVGTGLRAAPDWSVKGAFRLDAAAKALPGIQVAGADGSVMWPLDQAPPGTFLVQALVAPAGETAGRSLGSRWTRVVELAVPARAAGTR